jgi:hypothetical protein
MLLLMVVMLGGLAASVAQIYQHHAPRDGEPGLSYTDVAGAYHGVKAESPMLRAMRQNHPPELPAPEREALVAWLSGTRLSEDFDNADLGEMAPIEIIARSCLSCHARANAEKHPIARRIPLDYFDDVRKVSVSRDLRPMERRILIITTHTHALALASLTAVIASLCLITTWPGLIRLGLPLVAALGLALDIGGGWAARAFEPAVWMILLGGGAYNGSMALMGLCVLVECLKPRRA